MTARPPARSATRWRAGAVLMFCALMSVAGSARAASDPPTKGDLAVATASNFVAAMERLAQAWAPVSGVRVTPVAGSTGKHYAQARNGAPFDAYFAADAERPRRLEADGAAVPGTRFTYALGVLALYSPDVGRIADGPVALRDGRFARLAIANPRLAPYGRAAMETLEALDLADSLRGRIVRGENVAQAMAFVRSGNAELGFVAWAQLLDAEGAPVKGSWWRVPAALHRPIEQQAVLLRDTAEGRAFLDFVRSDAGRAIIEAAGYGLP